MTLHFDEKMLNLRQIVNDSERYCSDCTRFQLLIRRIDLSRQNASTEEDYRILPAFVSRQVTPQEETPAACRHVAKLPDGATPLSRLEAHGDASGDRLRKGDFVKVCDDHERFWVQIISRKEKDIFVGRVANQLLFSNVDLGDHIELHTCNIYDVQRG